MADYTIAARFAPSRRVMIVRVTGAATRREAVQAARRTVREITGYEPDRLVESPGATAHHVTEASS